MSIFATKSIEQIKEEQLGEGSGGLKRVLGVWQLVMLGVGAIIGTGIFVLTGQAAAANAGPAIVISMVIAGVTSVLAALCYSEFASTVPVAGSAYTYAYATLGEFIAWVIGWDLILEYALGAATVAVGWSGILITLLNQLGLSFPASLSAAPGTIVPVVGGDPVTAVFNVPAIIVTVAVTALLIVGVSEAASVNGAIVMTKVAVLLIVIAAGALFINPANWHPFIPANTGSFGEYRMERRPARCRRDLLRLHRFRCRLDIRPGGAKPSTRHAARHPRLAGDLHAALRARVRRHGGARPLQEHAESGGAARAHDRGGRRSIGGYAVAGHDGGGKGAGDCRRVSRR